jgi:hypothetical protein
VSLLQSKYLWSKKLSEMPEAPLPSAANASDSRSSTPTPTIQPEDGKALNNEHTQQPSSDDPTDPSAPLEPFDWEDLSDRYYNMLQDTTREEEKIERDFQQLLQASLLLSICANFS